MKIPDWVSCARRLARTRSARHAFSMVELQVSFVVLGIAVAGLGPLVVMQSRHLEKIQSRLTPGDTYYVTPSTNAWARKLGAAATVSSTAPAAQAASPIMVIDDGDSGFSTHGSGWNYTSGSTYYPPGSTKKSSGGVTAASCYVGDCYYHSSSTSTSKYVTWDFTGLDPGWYDVRVTWLEGSSLATNAPFTIYDNTTSKGSTTVNQTVAPSGSTYGGRPWKSLGTYSTASGTLSIKLGMTSTGNIVADGVRLVPVKNSLQVLSIDKSLTSEDVTAHVSVTRLVP